MFWLHALFFAVCVQGNLLCEKGATIQPSTAMLTCDGSMTVYVDGVKLNYKTPSYKTAQNTTIPTGSSALAIHCHNPNQPPKILGTINVSTVTGNKDWVCAKQYNPARNSTQFVNTSWAPAVAYGRNELSIPYGKVEDISSSAEWIGTENGTDSLYCRFSLCPQNACYTIRMARIDNHRLINSVFDKFEARNVAECALKCHAAQNRCQSFNYKSVSRSCELNDSIELPGAKYLIAEQGVTYYYRSN